MWCCYRFHLDAASAAGRELGAATDAFAAAIVRQAGGSATWSVASAPARDGGVEVWFGLPHLPTHEALAPLWQRQLESHGLVAQRVPNRN